MSKQVTYGSVCSGIEAATVAWHGLGWQAAWFAEIEAFPSAVLAHHYPHVPNLGDMTTIRNRVISGEVAAPDILVGGTPCFTAGHMVLTSTGYRQIQDICVGDLVVTHTGKLKPVLRNGFKDAEVGLLSASGLPQGITCTADHPFLSVNWRMQNTRRNGSYCRVEHLSEPEWTPASQMGGRQWCALTQYEIKQPTIQSTKFDEKTAMYIAGMYLGDGHVRGWKGKNKKAVVLSLNPIKLEKLLTIIDRQQVTVAQERTSHRVHIYDTLLAEWLIDNFGSLADSKHIPAWCLCSPYHYELLQGYLDTDGSRYRNGYTINTVSKALAYGVADLFNACSYAASVALVETPETKVIEGRTVNQKDYYQVRAFTRELSRKSRVRHDYLLRSVSGFKPLSTSTVFNIEVEGDNSYVVNGVVVHNCQAFSVAGARQSLDDERGQLTLEFVRLANEIDAARHANGQQPCIIVWENVPGVLNTRDNAFGCFLGALSGAECELQPSGKKWTNAGCVFGSQRAIAYRILDAQYFGLAQRRKRIFVIASAREGFNPDKILFEWESLRRDSPPSRETRQDIAANVTPGFTASSFGGYRAGVGTLRAHGGDLGGGSETLALQPRLASGGNWIGRKPENGGNAVEPMNNISPCLTKTDRHGVGTQYGVRRLTPTECERLQGFPDSFTQIPYRNKSAVDCPDSPRYAALGNSMAVPVMAWIGKRINDTILAKTS